VQRRRRVLVKFGGATLGDPALRARLADDLRAVADADVDLVVVHGGGPQTSALMRRLGVEPEFRAGRRVTDAATLEIAAWTLVGGVATELLAALLAAGVRAVSTPVASGGLLRSVRRPPRKVSGEPEPVDFGEVADPAGVDAHLLETLWRGGFVPVLSSLCVDGEGRRLNLNADTAARAIAEALAVDDVIAVADVPGVFGDLADPSTHLPELTPEQVRARIEDGTVMGGMVAKLEEMVAQVQAGVGACWIVGAHEPEPISAAVAGRPGRRTRVAAGAR
jgi:acetylglutamate kinase